VVIIVNDIEKRFQEKVVKLKENLGNLKRMTEEEFVATEMEKAGYSMEPHDCVTCKHFRIWGTDYSQYYDCMHDDTKYRELPPDHIEYNRCQRYVLMKINKCLICGEPGIKKCLVLVQSPSQKEKRVPETGYWCDNCKKRHVLVDGNFVPMKA
jgi:hypothetical protein